MDGDQELPDDQLPPGLTPIWIQPPGGATKDEMLRPGSTEGDTFFFVLFFS